MILFLQKKYPCYGCYLSIVVNADKRMNDKIENNNMRTIVGYLIQSSREGVNGRQIYDTLEIFKIRKLLFVLIVKGFIVIS